MRVHIVDSGETLGQIAEKYGFSSYEPIYNYNTKVQQNILSADPNEIMAGTSIVIPRSYEKYESVVKLLQSLKQSVVDDAREIEEELGAIKGEADAYAGEIDLYSELATLTVTGTAQVARLGSKRLTKMLIKKKTLQAAQKVIAAALPQDGADSLVIDKATGAAVDNSIFVMADRGLRSAKVKKDFAKGMAKGYAKKTAIFVTRAITPVEHANGSAELVSIVLDGILSGVDAIKPSNIAKAWLWATTSETPDDTNRKALEQVRRTTGASLDRLSSSISRLQKEKSDVYPSGAPRGAT